MNTYTHTHTHAMYRHDRCNTVAVERAGAAQQRADEDAARARRGAVGNVAPDQLSQGAGARDGRHGPAGAVERHARAAHGVRADDDVYY